MGGQKKFSFLLFVFGCEDKKSGQMKNLFVQLRRKMRELKSEVGINL